MTRVVFSLCYYLSTYASNLDPYLIFEVPSKDGRFDIKIEGITVDLKNNTITVATDNYEVVQNLALIFSIAVLQVNISH